MLRFIKNSFYSLGGIFALFLSALIHSIGNTQAETEIDPFHPNCTAAFRHLPISEHGSEAIEIQNDGTIVRVGSDPDRLREHILRHSEAYRDYDASCFFPFQCMQQDDSIRCPRKATRDIVNSTVGALFVQTSLSKYQPYCSAFRISASLIVTAAHCLKPLMHFRLAGEPARILNVYLADPQNRLGVPNSDLEDYAIIRIDKPEYPFLLKSNDFVRDVAFRQSINIIAVSMPAFELPSLGAGDWVKALRFTRLNAAHIWSFVEAGRAPLNASLESECLLHRAPTFPGMSGAPILAIKRPSVESGEPQVLIMGIHLRNGFPPSACGDWSDFNVGLRLPTKVLQRVGEP